MVRQKICCVCGQDVSQVKRTKDAQGNYYCDPCWTEKARAAHLQNHSSHSSVSPAPARATSKQAESEMDALEANALAALAEDDGRPVVRIYREPVVATTPVEQSVRPANTSAMPSASATKKCPFCAEIINADAIKCRFCGEIILDDSPQRLKGSSTLSPVNRETVPRIKSKRTLVGVAIVVGVLLMAGVYFFMSRRPAGATVAANGSSNRFDLSTHPELLLDKTINRTSYRLGGVALGDAEDRIPPAWIKTPKSEYGWIEHIDGNICRIENGKVTSFAIRNEAAVARLGLTSIEEIKASFGPPDSTSTSIIGTERTPDNRFIAKRAISALNYHERGLHVYLDIDGKKQVNIFLESPIYAKISTFVAECAPFVAQIKALQARLDSGINYIQFNEKLQLLIETKAQIGKVPEESQEAIRFADYADNAMASYKGALESWGNSINVPGLQFLGKDLRDKQLRDAAGHASLMNSTYELMKTKAKPLNR